LFFSGIRKWFLTVGEKNKKTDKIAARENSERDWDYIMKWKEE
jgi:hypothetical protein